MSTSQPLQPDPSDTANETTTSGLTDRIRRYWDEQAPGYDKKARIERFLISDSRAWICAQATGDTLEVAAGTGRNIPLYPRDVRLTGVDLSPGMLAVARQRTTDLPDRNVELREADAEQLPFQDSSFDTVVATLAMCAVPDLPRTIAEMHRVLRPGGLLLLLDHVRPSFPPLLWLLAAMQKGMNKATPGNGEQLLRRPFDEVVAAGLTIERQQRFKGGAIERLAARKPT